MDLRGPFDSCAFMSIHKTHSFPQNILLVQFFQKPLLTLVYSQLTMCVKIPVTYTTSLKITLSLCIVTLYEQGVGKTHVTLSVLHSIALSSLEREASSPVKLDRMPKQSPKRPPSTSLAYTKLEETDRAPRHRRATLARLGIYIDRILTTLLTPPNTFYKANKDVTKAIIMNGGSGTKVLK